MRCIVHLEMVVTYPVAAAREENFQKAAGEAQGQSVQLQLRKKAGSKGTEQSEQSDVFKLVRMIVERNYDPVSNMTLVICHDDIWGPHYSR